ncbi:MAG: hypothetical protein WBM83_15855, partial [Flavobacteriaceae bacterium]
MKTTRIIEKLGLSLAFVIFLGASTFVACSNDDTTDTIDSTDDTDDDTTDDTTVVNVNSSYFYTADGSVTITTVPCTLSDGTSTDCYQIVTTSLPGDHEMG